MRRESSYVRHIESEQSVTMQDAAAPAGVSDSQEVESSAGAADAAVSDEVLVAC